MLVVARRKREEDKLYAKIWWGNKRKEERAAAYVASFFTSSSERRSTFTSLWHNVHRASATSTSTSTSRAPTTASVVRARVFTCQKSISSSVERRSPPLWGEACLRPRCPRRKPPLFPSVTSQLFLVESFHRLSV